MKYIIAATLTIIALSLSAQTASVPQQTLTTTAQMIINTESTSPIVFGYNSVEKLRVGPSGPVVPSYTVSTLPSASTAGAGAVVRVSDATTFTVGTCTGGGSDTMLAISDGSAWSCH